MFGLSRNIVKPFTDRQASCSPPFADQAVIAIENARLLSELRQRTDDLSESLEQQTATSEILSVISGSPTDVQPTLDAIVKTAVSLCDSYDAVILQRDGDYLGIAAHHGPMALDFKGAPLGRDWVAGRTVLDRAPVHVGGPDLGNHRVSERRGNRRSAQQRTVLGLPLLREGQAIGCLFLRRTEVRPFSEKQVVLLQTFAAQAVIAIENTRLFTELRQRTDDLSESLEQQTATSEVLKVISSSPGELESVFNAMLENATRICGANFGNLLLYDGEAFRVAALHGAQPEWTALRQRQPVIRPGPHSPLHRVIHDPAIPARRRHAHGARLYRRGPSIMALVDVAGARSFVAVPMLKDDQPVGIISIYRLEVRPSPPSRSSWYKISPPQAVIAIENARLLNELRESLQRQTATSEVLKVISSSPGELEPVFNSMLENATRICEAKFGTLFRYDGDKLYRIAGIGVPAALVEFQRQRGPFRPEPGTQLHHVLQTKQAAHVADDAVGATPGMAAKYGGARTYLAVPMLKDDELVGAFVIYRQEVRPFTDKQIELVQNFAAQAVIAIENSRLLNELRQRTDDLSEALEQQTATSEVLKVISSSPGDLARCSELCLKTQRASAKPSSKFVPSRRRRLSHRCNAGSAVNIFKLVAERTADRHSRQSGYAACSYDSQQICSSHRRFEDRSRLHRPQSACSR